MAFFDRGDEIAALEERWASGRAEYVIIYGRRRIGKTELVLHFARDKRCLYFEATAGTQGDHLADISATLADLTGRSLLAELELSSWAAVFAAIEEELARGPMVVTLDEFQFVARQTPDIGSQINRFWRRHKDDQNLFFILSGSDISFFERELAGYAATSYGRRTGALRLQPFAPAEIASFLPGWAPEDLVRAYAVFGGVPYYLENLEPQRSLEENIWRSILVPDGLLHQEPFFLLAQQSDLREDSIYFSALRAVSAGQTRRNQIAQRIGRSDDQAGKVLDRLIDMGLIKRTHPATALNPERTKMVRYAMNDPFLRFWFTFVHPYQARLHSRESARRHLDERVVPRLDEFVSAPPFEEVCRHWLRARTAAASVGSWWGSVKERRAGSWVNVSREVDAVAIDGDGRVLAIGSCKWTEGEMALAEKALLERLEPNVVRGSEAPDRYFFSRSGFSRELRRATEADSRSHLVSVPELI